MPAKKLIGALSISDDANWSELDDDLVVLVLCSGCRLFFLSSAFGGASRRPVSLICEVWSSPCSFS